MYCSLWKFIVNSSFSSTQTVLVSQQRFEAPSMVCSITILNTGRERVITSYNILKLCNTSKYLLLTEFEVHKFVKLLSFFALINHMALVFHHLLFKLVHPL